ncbi:hypothetical protein [Nitrosopumilus sp.]|uniref:hypothetical protein n=1 Tax=Nitrosopumilus sp. TaxID=2024843 RepID=UPI0034A051E3
MKKSMNIKKIPTILFSILLLSMSFSTNSEIFADSIQQEKQNIIKELKELELDSETSKKTKKIINSTIKKLEKSLDDKFWKDESTINFKHGKNVLNDDSHAINKLDAVLKDKKEIETIKEKILQINIKILNVDKILVGNIIDSVENMIMSDKGLNKLNKAIEKFEEGSKALDDGDYDNAIKNFKKSLDLIKKSLKDPHFKKMKIVEHEGTLDMNFDGSPDVYLKIVDPNKKNKPKEIEFKITGECVNGVIHDDARMKIGISVPKPGPGQFALEFFDEEVHATNKWFKENDPNEKIDPVIISTISEYFSFPDSGDDLIQKNPEDREGSVDFTFEPISEIGNQNGWIGKFTLDVEPGDYAMHFWFPLTEPTIEGDSCNFISSFSVPTTFEDKIVKQVII